MSVSASSRPRRGTLEIHGRFLLFAVTGAVIALP